MKNRRYPRRVNMENERKNTEVRSSQEGVTRHVPMQPEGSFTCYTIEFLDSRFLFEGRRGGRRVRIRHNFEAAEHAVVNIAWNAAGIYSAIGKLGQSRWNNFSTTGRCIAVVPLIKLSYILFELNIFSLLGGSQSSPTLRRWWKMLYSEITRFLRSRTKNKRIKGVIKK